MEIGGATDRDTSQRAYLFRAGKTLHAVSHDASGGNLPTQSEGWVYDSTITVGVGHVMPFQHDPEPILRGLLSDGYYVWDAGNVNKGEGSGT